MLTMTTRISNNALRYRMAMASAVVFTGVMFVLLLFCGTVDIAPDAVAGALFGYGNDNVARMIVAEVRLPMALTALFAGMALAVSGLLMQTVFGNPLAGPSVLGISTGASLGVAVVMLGFGGWLGADSAIMPESLPVLLPVRPQ